MKQPRGPITTHVLDLSQGRPAAGLLVTLDRLQLGGAWKKLNSALTDGDGRIEDLLPRGSQADQGTYRLVFNTQAYFEDRAMKTFYPEVTVVFEHVNADQHLHVPLLLNAYGYSTYRGT